MHAERPPPRTQSELDVAKSETARLRREMERVEGERERLREEARRWGDRNIRRRNVLSDGRGARWLTNEVAISNTLVHGGLQMSGAVAERLTAWDAPSPPARLESSKQVLESELKEVRKALREELSGLKLEQNSARQAAYEAREAAERRQQQLAEALTAAEAAQRELEGQLKAAQVAAEVAQREAAALDGQLGELQARHQQLQERHQQVRQAGSINPKLAGLWGKALGYAVFLCLLAAATHSAMCPVCSCKRSMRPGSGSTTRWWPTAQ
jgi:predicted  nucleic acid-binding Zn-ribbon protein